MSDAQLSPYNTPARRPGTDQPVSVRFREITLRQLGHMEADMAIAEKVFFLRRLAEAGVAESIVWGADSDAAELVQRVRDAGIPLRLGFYGKTFFPDELKATMAKAEQCGADFICMNGRGAGFALKESGWSRQQMIEASAAAVREGKDRGLTISVGLYGFTQTTIDFIEDFGGAVTEAGADRIYCPDSLGVATPQTMTRLITALRAVTGITLEAHCHNDFGLGLANTLACVEAGTDIVEVAVNGSDPERCGIASLDEAAVSLEKLYGVDTGIRLPKLTELSRLHEEMTGMRVGSNKPIVGTRAFNYRVAPGEAKAEARRDTFYGSAQVVPFDPRDVGNERRFMLGKYSGPNEVRRSVAELGLQVAPEAFDQLVELVRDRGRREQRTVSGDELRYLVAVVS